MYSWRSERLIAAASAAAPDRLALMLRLTRWLAAGLVVGFALYVYAERLVDDANALRQQQLAEVNDLRQSANDSTRLANAYVATGDGQYRRQFRGLFEARRARLSALTAAGASMAVPGRVEEPEVDAALLTAALARADALARLEERAMSLWESGFGHEEERRLAASALLHEEAYHHAKAGVVEVLDRLYRVSDQRTGEAVVRAQMWARALWVLIVIQAGALLLTLGAAYRGLNRVLGGSAAQVLEVIRRLGRHDFSPVDGGQSARVGSVLQSLQEAQAQLSASLVRQREEKTRLEQEQQLDALRAFLLERITGSESLPHVLEAVAHRVEALLPGVMCSILLLDESATRLRLGAAPSLPEFFNRALDGIAIGPNVCSCGAAVFGRQRVVVDDMAKHPNWLPYKALTDRAGLRACWSEPLFSGEPGKDTALGSFALYRRAPGPPSAFELSVIEVCAGLIALAIERKRAEVQVQLLAKVFEHANELIMIADASARIVRVNAAFTRVTGYSEQEVLGRNPRMWSSGRHDKDFFAQLWSQVFAHGQWAGEVWNRKKDGTVYPSWLSISVLRGPGREVRHFVAIASDITQRKAAEERIRLLAEFDSLTGLPNRRLLQDRVQTALSWARRHQEPLALMFLDLDRFKNVNDSLGHQVGDALLVEAAQRIRGQLREQDTVCRIGGDEFVILCPAAEASGAAHVATHVLNVFRSPIQAGGHELAVGCSVGIAMFPADGQDFDSLLMAADAAMYRAKQRGRGRFCFYTAEMQSQSNRILELETGLRRALDEGQFHLVYQPQVDLESGSLVGAEALLRWNHPQLGAISPAEFIPVAEDSGLIVPIGEWVLRQACQQMRDWLDGGLTLNTMAVNLSLVQFRQADLPARVEQVLRECALAPQHLELEITEGVAMDQPQLVVAAMARLHALGVRIAVDDFGTGYSSLSYLKQLRLHKLKVDQSFVRDIATDADDRSIVSGIIGLARSLGYRTIAEGIETPEQWNFLLAQGCQEGQGYLISRPLQAQEFHSFVTAQAPGAFSLN